MTTAATAAGTSSIAAAASTRGAATASTTGCTTGAAGTGSSGFLVTGAGALTALVTLLAGSATGAGTTGFAAATGFGSAEGRVTRDTGRLPGPDGVSLRAIEEIPPYVAVHNIRVGIKLQAFLLHRNIGPLAKIVRACERNDRAQFPALCACPCRAGGPPLRERHHFRNRRSTAANQATSFPEFLSHPQ